MILRGATVKSCGKSIMGHAKLGLASGNNGSSGSESLVLIDILLWFSSVSQKKSNKFI